MSEIRSVLIIVTGQRRIDADHATGLWYEEYAVPYTRFREQGYKVSVASINGGPVPIDPRSMPESIESPANKAALSAIHQTRSLESIDTDGFDAVFFPGGHGAMFDLPSSPAVADLVARYLDQGKLVAAVCHGPAAFVNARRKDGACALQGRRLTCFTNEEEREVGLDQLMPFLLESRLRELGAQVETRRKWSEHVVVDGNLITGQNPQSSAAVATAIVQGLGRAEAEPMPWPGEKPPATATRRAKPQNR